MAKKPVRTAIDEHVCRSNRHLRVEELSEGPPSPDTQREGGPHHDHPDGDNGWPWDRRLDTMHLAVRRSQDHAYVHFGDGTWRCYDLAADPTEATNLAWPDYQRDAEQEAAYQRLLSLLQEVEQTRLQPLA